MREGSEAFEYLTLLSKLGDERLARELARSVLPTAYSAGAEDPAPLMEARERLARRILQLQGSGAKPATPTPGAPVPTPGDSDALSLDGGGCSSGGSGLLRVSPALVAGALALRRRRQS